MNLLFFRLLRSSFFLCFVLCPGALPAEPQPPDREPVLAARLLKPSVKPEAKTTPKASAKKAKTPVTPVVPKKPSRARNPYLGAIVVDAADGRVLFEDQADAKGYPASVLKLMLLLTAMEQIKEGRLSLQDEVTVSAHAVTNEGAYPRLLIFRPPAV